MPVRKTPRNYLHVTGKYASNKNATTNAFESLLEKDLMILLEFDDSVVNFEEQPVHVPVPGHIKPYTPDILIQYGPTVSAPVPPKPLLAEVKHTDFLEKKAEEYAPKFAAAQLFAESRGWDFKVITEKETRTPRLANLKFLKSYRSREATPADYARIVSAIELQDSSTTLQKLLPVLADSDAARLHWIAIVWSAVCRKIVQMDFDVAMGADPELWLE